MSKIGELDYVRCIRLRIACPEMGYPISEALYFDIRDYEEQTGKLFYHSYCDNCGYCDGDCPSCAAKGRL